MYWLLIVLHIGNCLFFHYLRATNRLISHNLVMPMVWCIPLWGTLLAIVDEYTMRQRTNASKAFELERLELTDQRYRSIEVDSDENKKITVPLEEAMLINDAKTRRSLMLDILHKNPKEYLDLLQRARLSDDVELTHYATTTIMEVQSEYEALIQQCEAEVLNEPENEKLLRNYAKAINLYIKSNLISGNILLIQRVELKRILEKIIEICPDDHRKYVNYIENELEIEPNERLRLIIEDAMNKWPHDEKIYMLYVNYYWKTGQGKKIQELLKQMRQKKIYLSKEGKEWYSFWKREEAKE